MMEEYLWSFPEPQDPFDRSFYQYKCQMKQLGGLLSSFLNIMASVSLPILMLLTKTVKIEDRESNTAVFFSNGLDNDYMTPSLLNRYEEVINYKNVHSRVIDEVAKGIVYKMIARHPLSPFWILKNFIKLSFYSRAIQLHPCKDIISSCEYSYTSSVLTLYCNMRGKKHINIMHGDKLFNIRDSFFLFDKFVIWDEHYGELFTDLRASIGKVIVDLPSFFLADNKVYGSIIDYKYYLQKEDEEQLRKIHLELLRLKEAGKTVVIRPHPLYSNNKMVKQIFKDFEIEDTSKIDIMHSIMSSSNVVSRYSTVLFQAYINGVNTIIDDVSIQGVFEQLTELRYIMITKVTGRLSDL
ncbi:MAG: hypothetical protein QM221_05505 [Bacillota bacterium]|nr:hypothetical protein [Bacillota bacterium]